MYYGTSGIPSDVVCGLREDLASAFRVDKEKLYPSTRFYGELHVATALPIVDEIDELLEDAWRLSRDRVGRDPAELPKIETVDDYIRAFGELAAQVAKLRANK